MTSHDYQRLSSELLARRRPTGDWNGLLASSAISTATAAIALYELDHVRHAQPIAAACQWLADTQLDNGAWGDTPESPPNLTASLLAGAALMRTKTNPAGSRPGPEIPVHNPRRILTSSHPSRHSEKIWQGFDLCRAHPRSLHCHRPAE